MFDIGVFKRWTKFARPPYPQVGVFEVGAVVLDNVGRVTLLHDRDLFDDFLKIRINRHLESKRSITIYRNGGWALAGIMNY